MQFFEGVVGHPWLLTEKVQRVLSTTAKDFIAATVSEAVALGKGRGVKEGCF